MAGPCRRGSGAADHRARRARDERHSADDHHPLDLALRLVRRHPHLSRTAPTTISRASRCSTACGDLSLPSGVTPVGVAAVLAVGPDLPLRAAKPRPLADGAQDLRGLDRRAAISAPCPAWPTIPASAAAPCSTRCCSIRPGSPRVGLSVQQVESALAANNGNAGGGFYSQGGQFYYVRGLGRLKTLEDIGNVVVAVHDGTPVLVKDVGRVVIGIAPRLGEFGYREAGRRRRRRHPAAHRREDPGRAEAGRGQDHGAQRADPAEGRQGRAVLRPQRPGRADDRDVVEAQPAARHVAGRRGPDLLPLRLPRRADRRRDASRWRCCSPSSASICRTPRPTCCPSARSISASWSMARWSWWRTSSARSPRAKARRSTSWRSSATRRRRWTARCSMRWR